MELQQGKLHPFPSMDPPPTHTQPYLAELLQLLLVRSLFCQGSQDLQELGAGWGRDIQEEGQRLVQCAGRQAAIRDPQALWAWIEVGGAE